MQFLACHCLTANSVTLTPGRHAHGYHTGQAFALTQRHVKVRRLDTALVFPDVTGRKALGIREAFESAVKRAGIEDFRFHEACHLIYQFFWGDFCDWYIEWVKPQLTDANREIAIAAWRNIFAAFDATPFDANRAPPR